MKHKGKPRGKPLSPEDRAKGPVAALAHTRKLMETGEWAAKHARMMEGQRRWRERMKRLEELDAAIRSLPGVDSTLGIRHDGPIDQ